MIEVLFQLAPILIDDVAVMRLEITDLFEMFYGFQGFAEMAFVDVPGGALTGGILAESCEDERQFRAVAGAERGPRNGSAEIVLESFDEGCA